MTKHTSSEDARCKKCGSVLTQQRYCWNEQCEYYGKPQRVNPDIPVIMQTIHRPTGAVLVNEQCTCGHLKSSHGDTVAPYHGACKLAGCNCVRFTWTSFVTREGRSVA